MRFTVSNEQLTFFLKQNYLELEDLLSEEEAALLLAAISDVRKRSQGYPEENFYRSIPLISSLAKKRGWGEVASKLLNKKPLRLAHDKFCTSFPSWTEPLENDSCAVVIELNTRRGLFFTQSLLYKSLYNSSCNSYLLLILTAKYLPDQLNPLIIK
jgi:hypothetical protein